VEKDPNNTSIVIRLQYGEVSFLLVGDAEGKERKDPADVLKFVEKDLIQEYGNTLKSTFLKAGHHGSESSSTNAFIDVVSPQYVIICAGNKKFSGTVLPDKSVIKRYDKRHIKIYRTDKDDE
jgi:competence protein ComEC